MEAERSTMYQGVAKASAAFRLMQQMGWSEGDGLGRERQGIREHLRVRKKQDNAGLGLSQKALAQANWILNTKTYENILSNLKVVATDDAEVLENRSELQEVEDSNVSSTGLPLGRANKKRQKKAVGTYSTVEVDEVLGVSKGKLAAECLQAESVPQSGGVIYGEYANAKKQKVTDQVCEKLSSYRGSPKLWWCLFGFVRAGNLGSSNALKTDVSKPAGFKERDQENLYNLVFDTATKSRRGLGVEGKNSSKRRKGSSPGWNSSGLQAAEIHYAPSRHESLDVKEGPKENDAKRTEMEKKVKTERKKMEKDEDRQEAEEKEEEKLDWKKTKTGGEEVKNEKIQREGKDKVDKKAKMKRRTEKEADTKEEENEITKDEKEEGQDRKERKEEKMRRKQEKRMRKEEQKGRNEEDINEKTTSDVVSLSAEPIVSKKRKKDVKAMS